MYVLFIVLTKYLKYSQFVLEGGSYLFWFQTYSVLLFWTLCKWQNIGLERGISRLIACSDPKYSDLRRFRRCSTHLTVSWYEDDKLYSKQWRFVYSTSTSRCAGISRILLEICFLLLNAKDKNSQILRTRSRKESHREGEEKKCL